MFDRIVFIVVGVFLLAACAPKDTTTPLDKWAIEHQAARTVTCKAGADCDEKWGRAIEWVRANSAKNIKTLTDDIIQTEEVFPGGREAGGTPAFTIIKYAKSKGIYAIDYSTACETVPNYKCNPSALVLRATFNYYVMGPEHFKAPPPNAAR